MMERERHQFVAFVVLSSLITVIQYMLYINSPQRYYASMSYVDRMYVSQNGVQNVTINGMPHSPFDAAQHSLVDAVHQYTTSGEQHSSIDGVQHRTADGGQHSTTHGEQHSTTHGEQHSTTHGEQHSNIDGVQHRTADGGQPSTTHGEQHSTANGRQHSTTYGGQRSTTYGRQHRATDSGQHSTASGGQHRTTVGGQHPTPNAMLHSPTDTMQHTTIHDTPHPPIDTIQNTHVELPTTSAVQHLPTDAIHHSSVDTSAIQHTSTDSVSWTTQPAGQTSDNDSISAAALPVSLTRVCTSYDGASQSFATRDLIVRAAYFDDRRHGSHRNTIVFLIEVRISILKQNLITGCAAGEHRTKKFEVHRLNLTGWVHQHHPELSHDTVLVNCFNLPVQIGSRAFVLYRRSKHSFTTCVESERPVMIPAPRLPLARHQKFTVAICCATVYGMPPLLTEWLQYQRTIATDHVHLIAEDSFVEAGGLDNKQLKQAMHEGFVTVDVWKPWLNKSQIFYHSQVLAHEDCIYRLRGTYDYVMLMDLDEFFIPRVVGQTKIHYYVNRCCANRQCGSCHFHEYMYYPDCGLNGEVGDDGNITSKLVSYEYLDQPALGKSVHRSAAIVETGCHRGNEYMRGYRKFEFPVNLAYIAHVRKGQKPSRGKC